MSIITLTSEWSYNDFYIGAVKGAILSNYPECKIIDIAHELPAFNLSRAAFILKNCYKYYPKNSVHIIGINNEAFDTTSYVVVKKDEQYFIGADNGIFGLIFEDKPEIIIKINITPELEYSSFPELDIFSTVAAFLSNGGDINELGPKLEKTKRKVQLLPTYDDKIINGNVIYIDSYKNVISNISVELFNQIHKGRKFDILVQSYHYKISKINKKYNETPAGELLAIFNSAGLLEVAINNGRAAELLNLDNKSNIRIKFYDN